MMGLVTDDQEGVSLALLEAAGAAEDSEVAALRALSRKQVVGRRAEHQGWAGTFEGRVEIVP